MHCLADGDSQVFVVMVMVLLVMGVMGLFF